MKAVADHQISCVSNWPYIDQRIFFMACFLAVAAVFVIAAVYTARLDMGSMSGAEVIGEYSPVRPPIWTVIVAGTLSAAGTALRLALLISIWNLIIWIFDSIKTSNQASSN